MVNLDEQDVLRKIELEALQKIKDTINELYSVWQEIGIDIDRKVDRVQVAWSHIQNLVQDIKDEEYGVFEDLKKQITDRTDKILTLSKCLGVEANEAAGIPLMKRAEVLDQELNDLIELKKTRMQEYKELKETERRYCKLLGMQEHQLSSNIEVPSALDLKELTQCISMMKQEEIKRHEQYLKLTQQLVEIFTTTELKPENKLEEHVLAGKDLSDLSNKMFEDIIKAVDSAQKRKQQLESHKKSLMNEITVLWNRLRVDSPTKLKFISKHVDCKASTIKSMEQELSRCEEIKMQNIKVFIDSIIQELKCLWDKCGVSDFDKQVFQKHFAPEMSAEVLVAHEQEVEKWKTYYEKVKIILEKIEKRNRLWDLLTALDNKANDPSRFKNRGGNLLQEERERNKLQKTLPTLENEISQGIELYEAEKGEKFLYFGKDYRLHIFQQWQERLNHKENLKQERNLLPVTPLKRPAFTTPKSAPPCMRNVALPIYRTPSVKPKITSHTVKKPPLLRVKSIKKRDQDVLKTKQNKVKSSSHDTTYIDFAKELNRTERQVFRSSVLTSKKIGGTRISSSKRRSLTPKNKRKSASKHPVTPDKDIDLTSVREKSGLPFVM